LKIQYKRNVGIFDRMQRVWIGTILFILGIFVIKDTVGIVLTILSIPLLFSAVTGFCPTYVFFGITTNRKSSCC
jgi:hypothetical protein